MGGTLFGGPYIKDPAIWGTIIRVPHSESNTVEAQKLEIQ